MTAVASGSAEAGHAYCCVTLVRGARHVDLALPSSVPLADLLPGIVRLVQPENSRHADEDDDEDDQGPRWTLAPLGRQPIGLTETLSGAGVVDGDLLMLDDARETVRPPGVASVRDAIESGVEQRRFWDARATAVWLSWTTILGLAALGLALALPVGGSPGAAAVAPAWAAVAAAIVAVHAGRASDNGCAATALVLACVYAGWCGVALAQHWSSGGAVQSGWPALPALGGATAVAATVAVWWRPATVMVIALATLLLAVTVVVTLVTAGGDAVAVGLVTAVVAALIPGALPRLVLAGTAMSTADPADPRFPRRLEFAQRLLTGCLLGASAAVVAGVIPAVCTDDRGLRWLVLGFGCLMLLRARAFGQVGHTIGPRVCGLLVIGVVWAAGYLSAPSARSELVAAATVSLASLAAFVASGPVRPSSVTAARAGRVLDGLEVLLVVALVVGTAGELGVTSWALSVLG